MKNRSIISTLIGAAALTSVLFPAVANAAGLSPAALPASCASPTEAGSVSAGNGGVIYVSNAGGKCSNANADRNLLTYIYEDIPSSSDRQIGPGSGSGNVAQTTYSAHFQTCDGGKTEKVYGEAFWNGDRGDNTQAAHETEHMCS